MVTADEQSRTIKNNQGSSLSTQQSFIQTHYPMKFQPKQLQTIFQKLSFAILGALCFVSQNTAAKPPEYDPNGLKSYKKIGLVHVISDEQLFVTKRRFGDGGAGTAMGTSTGLLGAVVSVTASQAQRGGFAATHKPFNDAVKRNMRPELEKSLFDLLTARLKASNALRLEWSIPALDSGIAYGDSALKAKYLADTVSKCPDCDATLIVDAGFGAHDVTTSTGLRARAEAEVFFLSLPDGKIWQRSLLISEDKDIKFHQLYYPDAITNAAEIANRLPALVPMLADQIVPPR